MILSIMCCFQPSDLSSYDQFNINSEDPYVNVVVPSDFDYDDIDGAFPNLSQVSCFFSIKNRTSVDLNKDLLFFSLLVQSPMNCSLTTMTLTRLQSFMMPMFLTMISMRLLLMIVCIVNLLKLE